MKTDTTTFGECSTCLSTGVHCASFDFSQTACCDFAAGSDELKACMEPYQYCTQNVFDARVTELTCPSQECEPTYISLNADGAK